MRERNEPFRQDGEGLPAWMADPTANPNNLTSVIVRLAEPPTVADDRPVMAERAQPWQYAERNHPGSGFVLCLWQCDKENHGWREGPPLRLAWKRFDLLPGLHPPG